MRFRGCGFAERSEEGYEKVEAVEGDEKGGAGNEIEVVLGLVQLGLVSRSNYCQTMNRDSEYRRDES